MSATRNRRAALPGTRGLLPSLFSGVPHSSKGRPPSQKFAAALDFPPICEQVMVPAASPVILLFAEINRRRNEHQGTFDCYSCGPRSPARSQKDPRALFRIENIPL